jgi:phage gpG-like protein
MAGSNFSKSDERFSIIVDPDSTFKALLERVGRATGDLTIPFLSITKSWFKGNRAIFELKSPGKYQDLTPKYKKAKFRAVGFVYPILERSGLLKKSLVEPGDPSSIALTVNKTTLLLGTRDRTAVWHQGGTRRGLPARPMVLLGPEQVSPEGVNRRRESWIKIIEDYMAQTIESSK